MDSRGPGDICDFFAVNIIKCRFDDFFLIAGTVDDFFHLLLAGVRGVPHNRVKPAGVFYLPFLNAKGFRPAYAPFFKVKALVADFQVEKIIVYDVGVVLVHAEVVYCEVDCRQVRGKFCDVTAPKCVEYLLMGFSEVHHLFVLIRADQECASTAGGVKDLVILVVEAEAENEINHIRAGEILPQLVSFHRRNQTLKDPANNIIANG